VSGIVLFSLVILGGYSCAPGSSESISIGAALPLTGPVSYYGVDSKRGIDLALEQVNAEGGVQGKTLKVIYEDTQGQGKQAVSAVRKLISSDGVAAIIGAGTSTETMAIAPVMERSKVVLISPVSSAASISEAGEYIFRSVPSDAAQAESLADWILSSGFDRIALLYVNQTWGVGLKDDFVRAYKSRGGNILAEVATDLDEKDFRTQLTQMRASSPQAYAAIIYAKEGGLLLKQARELGIGDQFFGADPWTKQELIDAAGDAAEGVRFTTPATYDGPEFESFRKAYLEKYQVEPGIYDAHGYDCLKILASALRQSDLSGPSIRNALARTTGFVGATGETTFDLNGDVPTKSFSRMEWSGGSLRIADNGTNF
jgi:branched-chain amino acid transport system substrate-binding protein